MRPVGAVDSPPAAVAGMITPPRAETPRGRGARSEGRFAAVGAVEAEGREGVGRARGELGGEADGLGGGVEGPAQGALRLGGEGGGGGFGVREGGGLG